VFSFKRESEVECEKKLKLKSEHARKSTIGVTYCTYPLAYSALLFWGVKRAGYGLSGAGTNQPRISLNCVIQG